MRTLTLLVASALTLGCDGPAPVADRSTADLQVPPPQLPFGGRNAAQQPPRQAQNGADAEAAQSQASAQQPTQQTLEDLGHFKGSPDAPIRVIEFSDFGCGYCRKFHEETYPIIVDEFVNTGKVQWRSVQFNNGMFPNAQEAALAGECAAAQGHFESAADGLFGQQKDWKGGSDPDGVFKKIAVEAGLDMARFESCMSTRELEESVDVATQLARQLGIRGTPTFFIEGFPVQGALPIELFREYFTAVLAEKEKQTG